LNAQLGRGYLDEDNPHTLETYIKGRQDIYDFYLKVNELLALEDQSQNANETASTALTVSQYSKALSEAFDLLSTEEQARFKFMLPYYGTSYEGETAYAPISWVSPVYDDPILRNPEGGLFANKKLYFIGDPQNSVIQNNAVLYGKEVTHLKAKTIANERSSFTYTTYRANTSYKKGRGWFGNDKYSTDIVAIPCSEVQPTTGIIQSGPEGEVIIEAEKLDNLNGAEIHAGTEGQKLLVGTVNSTPAINTYPVRFDVAAKGYSATVHGVGAEIIPAQVTSTGGMDWEVKTLNLTGTHVVEREKDIYIGVDEGHLLTTLQTVLADVTAEGNSKTTTVQTVHQQIGAPTVIAAINGDVHFHASKFVDGVAPVILGNNISLTGKFDLPGTFLHHEVHTDSQTNSTFSSSHTVVNQQILAPLPTVIRANTAVILDGEMNLPGTDLEAAKSIHLKPNTSLTMEPVIERAHHHQETTTRSPLAHGNAGVDGYREMQNAPRIKAKKLIQDDPRVPIRLTNAELDVEDVQARIETYVRYLVDHQEEWSNQVQVIPQPLVVAITMALTYYTGGLLGAALKGLGTLGAAITAGAKTIISMASYTFFRTGDPELAVAGIVSRQGRKSIMEDMFVAAVLHTTGSYFKADRQTGFLNHLQNDSFTNGVKTGVKIAMGTPAEQAFLHGLKQTAIETAGATSANTIGLNVDNPLLHDAALAGSAALLDIAAGGNRETAFSAAGAAAMASRLGALIDPDKLMKEVKAEGHPEKDHQKVFAEKRNDFLALIEAITVGTTMTLGGDQAAAIFAAGNVLHHNVALRMDMPQRPVLQPQANPAPSEEEQARKETEQRKLEEKRRKARKAAAQKKKQQQADLAREIIVQQLLNPSPQEVFQQKLFEAVTELALEEQQARQRQQDDMAHELVIQRLNGPTPQEAFRQELFEVVRDLASEEQQDSQRGFTTLAPDSEFIYPALRGVPLHEIKEKAHALLRQYVEYVKEDMREQRRKDREALIAAANRDILQEIASLPIPGAMAAAFAYEGRDIYRGEQTVGGAAIDIVSGIVQGKLMIAGAKKAIWAGKKMIAGGKYVWQRGKELLRAQPNMTNTLHAFAHNEQGAGRGFGQPKAVFKERPLLAEDIGQKAKNLDVFGTISGDGEKIVVKLNWVKNKSISAADVMENLETNNWRLHKPTNPLPTGFVETMMKQLTSLATKSGATTLQFESVVFNRRFADILSRRYNAIDRFGDSLKRSTQDLLLTIPLTPGKAPQLSNLTGEAKTTGKISSFIPDETGAGKNIVSGFLGLGRKAVSGVRYVCQTGKELFFPASTHPSSSLKRKSAAQKFVSAVEDPKRGTWEIHDFSHSGMTSAIVV
jgi:hypothetical protein